MDLIFIQALNGLASASSLFLVASGLSIIFGVTRVVNFAHGSFYMLGAYIAWSLVTRFGPASVLGFWGGVILAALLVGVIGVANRDRAAARASTRRRSCSNCWQPSAWC